MVNGYADDLISALEYRKIIDNPMTQIDMKSKMFTLGNYVNENAMERYENAVDMPIYHFIGESLNEKILKKLNDEAVKIATKFKDSTFELLRVKKLPIFLENTIHCTSKIDDATIVKST